MITITIPAWVLGLAAGMWTISTILKIILWRVNTHLNRQIGSAQETLRRGK